MSPLPLCSRLACVFADLFTGTVARGAYRRLPAASGGPSRTPRPTGCAVTRDSDFSVLRVAACCFSLHRVPSFRAVLPGRDLSVCPCSFIEATSADPERRVEVGSHPTRLETRTKESNMCASRRVTIETREAQ